MRKIAFAILAALYLAIGATPGYAARFTQGVISAPSTQFYFDYTLTPSPTVFSPGTSFSIVANVCDYNTVNGFECGPDTLTFFSEAAGGGFSRLRGYLATPDEPGRYDTSVLYAGTEANPVFLPGSYPVSTAVGEGTFTIARETGAVPEAATWAMMLIGFAGIGASIRRRARAPLRA